MIVYDIFNNHSFMYMYVLTQKLLRLLNQKIIVHHQNSKSLKHIDFECSTKFQFFLTDQFFLFGISVSPLYMSFKIVVELGTGQRYCRDPWL